MNYLLTGMATFALMALVTGLCVGLKTLPVEKPVTVVAKVHKKKHRVRAHIRRTPATQQAAAGVPMPSPAADTAADAIELPASEHSIMESAPSALLPPVDEPTTPTTGLLSPRLKGAKDAVVPDMEAETLKP